MKEIGFPMQWYSTDMWVECEQVVNLLFTEENSVHISSLLSLQISCIQFFSFNVTGYWGRRKLSELRLYSSEYVDWRSLPWINFTIRPAQKKFVNRKAQVAVNTMNIQYISENWKRFILCCSNTFHGFIHPLYSSLKFVFFWWSLSRVAVCSTERSRTFIIHSQCNSCYKLLPAFVLVCLGAFCEWIFIM